MYIDIAYFTCAVGACLIIAGLILFVIERLIQYRKSRSMMLLETEVEDSLRYQTLAERRRNKVIPGFYFVAFKVKSRDPRPLSFPPNELIYAYQYVGSEYEDHEPTALYVAHIQIFDGQNPKDVIRTEWPEVQEVEIIRKTENKPVEEIRIQDWMAERYELMGGKN